MAANQRALVSVCWLDACTYDGWDDLADATCTQCIPVESIGFILERDKERIVLAQTIGTNDQTSAVIAIPSGCITRIRTLKRCEKPRKE